MDYVLEKLPFQVECLQTDNGAEFQGAFHWHVLDRGIGRTTNAGASDGVLLAMAANCLEVDIRGGRSARRIDRVALAALTCPGRGRPKMPAVSSQPSGDTITSRIGALAGEARRLGLIDMSAGVPRFGLDVASSAEADELSFAYGRSQGLPLLCEQLRGMYSPFASGVGELEVVVSCGATEAVASAILGLTVPGDRVGFIEPNYPGHVALIEVLGRVPVPLDLPVVVDDVWGADHLGPLALSMLLVSNPSNPAGRVLVQEELLELVGGLGNGYLVLDEVYSAFTADEGLLPTYSFPPAASGRVLRVHSASKLFGRPGWRVGWLVGAPEPVRAVDRAHSALVACAPTSSQWLVGDLLSQGVWRSKECAALVRRRLQQFCATLREGGLDVVVPEGGFYVQLASDAFESSVVLHAALRDRCGVQGVPWSWFVSTGDDVPAAVRLSVAVADDDAEVAADRIVSFLGARRA